MTYYSAQLKWEDFHDEAERQMLRLSATVKTLKILHSQTLHPDNHHTTSICHAAYKTCFHLNTFCTQYSSPHQCSDTAGWATGRASDL